MAEKVAEQITRVAAIDCGTNSIRLLIADIDREAGTLTDLERTMHVVRLGQGVDRTGRLDPEALARTFERSREYAAKIAELGATRVRFVATSATRDASNRDEFFSGIREILGVTPEVVSGDEEAYLSFRGATGVFGGQFPAPYLVVDLGGGSTELVLGTDRPQAAKSMDVGCVRMTERHLRSDPPTPAEIEAARADIRRALDEAAEIVPLGQTATLVGLAGSITTVTAHALGLAAYDRDRINGATLSVDDVLASAADLLARDRAQRAELGFMHPGRIDVIGAGALVWSEVVARVRDEVAAQGRELGPILTSEHDILDGIAWSLVE
ncbi:Ppx/GppA phosphatase family protein [Rarobacter faecitabidus]|uniref:Exopolyphosphatase/guanosine-5'-triphosphate, 3'-diphosphate pyrophosphatase n=1 Tax=Rarobacter faecitabidus TaxID=13243 RepID=A0A542ZTY9_RARFA|nr:Ppx/GppA phosphatase family protein [Rarobacter faecitabidus]TQL63824.1 exopolyphosphatase/guanosine-5'-triphosphate,3'-diphosphate pyrophosphatase [Rarobacter faecitabidus]